MLAISISEKLRVPSYTKKKKVYSKLYWYNFFPSSIEVNRDIVTTFILFRIKKSTKFVAIVKQLEWK